MCIARCEDRQEILPKYCAGSSKLNKCNANESTKNEEICKKRDERKH